MRHLLCLFSASLFFVCTTSLAIAQSGHSLHVVATQATDYAGYFLGGRNYFEGPVGIGTDSPMYSLHVEMTSEEGRAIFGIASAASSSSTFGGWFQSNSSGGIGLYGYSTGPASVGVLGNSYAPNGYDFLAMGNGINYGSFSSRRWKENIQPISSPLEMLSRLRGVFFDWDAEHGGHHDIGMIAEEVGAVLPEIVNYEENGIDAIAMDYSKLSPLLIQGLNALNAEMDFEIEKRDLEIQSLRESNAGLESRLNKLESRFERLVFAKTP